MTKKHGWAAERFIIFKKRCVLLLKLSARVIVFGLVLSTKYTNSLKYDV